MLNQLIMETLTDEEMDLVLNHVSRIKRAGFGRVEIKFENGKIAQIIDSQSENPAVLKGLYSQTS